MILQTTKVIVNNENEINFIIGDGTVIYKTDVNSFQEDAGLVINNVDFNSIDPLLAGYYVQLSIIGKQLSCGNIISNIETQIKKDIDNSLLIMDFDEVTEVSNNFLESYTKFLLQTKCKVISINMNTEVAKGFSNFVERNIAEKIE